MPKEIRTAKKSAILRDVFEGWLKTGFGLNISRPQLLLIRRLPVVLQYWTKKDHPETSKWSI